MNRKVLITTYVDTIVCHTRRFIQEIFVEGKLEDAKNFVTHDIIYHAQAEEVRGLEEFKEWIAMDRKALPDMEITILDDIAEQNKVALRSTLKATQEGLDCLDQLAMRSLRLPVQKFFILKMAKSRKHGLYMMDLSQRYILVLLK